MWNGWQRGALRDARRLPGHGSDPDQYSDRYGKLASTMGSRNAIFGAMVFATEGLSMLHDLLYDLDGVVIDRHPGRTDCSGRCVRCGFGIRGHRIGMIRQE